MMDPCSQSERLTLSSRGQSEALRAPPRKSNPPTSSAPRKGCNSNGKRQDQTHLDTIRRFITVTPPATASHAAHTTIAIGVILAATAGMTRVQMPRRSPLR